MTRLFFLEVAIFITFVAKSVAAAVFHFQNHSGRLSIFFDFSQTFPELMYDDLCPSPYLNISFGCIYTWELNKP